MSYLCYATNEIVSNEPRELIPIKIRKVIYIAQAKPDPRSDYLQFVDQAEGWEIVQEVAVRASKAEEFRLNHTPEIVGQKEVYYMKSRVSRPKFVKPSNEEEFED